MRTISFVICLLLFIASSGCVPNAMFYYKPTVDVESTHEKSHCVPTEKYVIFTIKANGSTLQVRGSGSVYSNSHGEVTEGQFVISGHWKEIKFKNEEFYSMVPGVNEKIEPLEIYQEEHELDGSSFFNTGAVFPKQNGADFDVIFPALVIDGQEVALPVLHIRRTIWVGMSPFNC